MSITASLQGPIAGTPTIGLGQYNLGSLGYVVEEYFYSRATPPLMPSRVSAATMAAGTRGPPPRRPSRPGWWYAGRPNEERFNGTVVVEWLNVSGGLDAPPDWYMTHRQSAARGDGLGREFQHKSSVSKAAARWPRVSI